jgi:transcriptional regulator with XRE-family HTH domain
MNQRRVSAEDAAIGHKLRTLRLERGMSQSALGRVAGVSFQQLQKYEKGDNRVSAGRLQRIAAALNVPVTVFYAGGGAKRSIDERSFAYLRTRGALRLVRAYAGIRERAPRIALLALAEALTQPSD